MTDTASDPRIERTRSAVLDAGVAILFEQGPDGVTHAAIANAARVSRTTLYKYWPTRAELLFDILNQVEPHKKVKPSGDVRTDLVAMIGEMAAETDAQVWIERVGKGEECEVIIEDGQVEEVRP